MFVRVNAPHLLQIGMLTRAGTIHLTQSLATGPCLQIVGVDCATDAKRTGLALATVTEGCLTLEAVAVGSPQRDALSMITEWIAATPDIRTLIALDAPLGWPAGR